jgi:hypothetical protein
MKKIFFLLLVSGITLKGFSQKDRDPSNYNYEIQFIRTGLEGTELFKVFSYCKKEKDCFEAAKIDAIKAIMFKGIPGSGLNRPLISDPGAEDKYRDYFQTFFNQNGKYLNFVSISNDGSIEDDDRLKVGNRLKIGVVVSVQKANLRRELEAAGIIKKLSEGF